MANLKELTEELKKLQEQIDIVLSLSGYSQYGDLEVEYDPHNPDDMLLANSYSLLMDKLASVQNRLKYLHKPIKCEGSLSLRPDGRYGISGTNIYFTSGSKVEFLDTNGVIDKIPVWRIGTVEHDETGYFIMYYKYVKLDGLRVRIRG